MKVFENQNVVIECDENTKCLIQNWKGLAGSLRFRESIEKTIELFEEKKLDKILSNTKESGMVKKVDTDWVGTYAMPILIKNGLKFMAFVVPNNIFTQRSIDNFKHNAPGPVEIRYFNDDAQAREWFAEIS